MNVPFWSVAVNTYLVHHRDAMKQTDPQYKLRLPQQLKEQIESAASESGRSMNAEIVARLQESFTGEFNVQVETSEELRDRLLLEMQALRDEYRSVEALIDEIEKARNSMDEDTNAVEARRMDYDAKTMAHRLAILNSRITALGREIDFISRRANLDKRDPL
jgi:hypothetical protein